MAGSRAGEPGRTPSRRASKACEGLQDFILRVMGFTGMVVFEEFPKLLSLFA